MAGLLVLLIILGCVAFQYCKGTFVKSFGTFAASLLASMVAYNYFELVANAFLSRGDQLSLITPWVGSLSFILVFILAYVIFQTVLSQLTYKSINLGFIAEKAGSCFFGLFWGLTLSGVLLISLVMAPLGSDLPYERFDKNKIDPAEAKKVFFNADGFVTGWFNIASKGSLSGDKSFAAVHPAFLNTAFLNRIGFSKNIKLTTFEKALEIKKPALWYAPEGIKDAENPAQPVKTKPGHKLMIVRIGIKKNMIDKIGAFSLSQLRIMCKLETAMTDALTGSSKVVYPQGYMKTADLLETKQLSEPMSIKKSDFQGKIKLIDFVFDVPNNYVPVLVEFRQNFIAKLPSLTPEDQAPQIEPYSGVKEAEPSEDEVPSDDKTEGKKIE